MTSSTITAATPQLREYIKIYKSILPLKTFPLIPFILAATFQCFAWFGGRYLARFTLLPRILILWLMALGEYGLMSPAMNAAVEVLNMKENTLIILYNVATLVVFVILSLTLFKNKYTWKHVLAFVFLLASVILVNS